MYFKKCCSISIVIFILMIALSGCQRYDAQSIEALDNETGKIIVIENDDAKKLLSILNGSLWQFGITKTDYDYVFTISDTDIRYVSSSGLFNDPTSMRHLYVSEDDRVYINSLLETE